MFGILDYFSSYMMEDGRLDEQTIKWPQVGWRRVNINGATARGVSRIGYKGEEESSLPILYLVIMQRCHLITSLVLLLLLPTNAGCTEGDSIEGITAVVVFVVVGINQMLFFSILLILFMLFLLLILVCSCSCS